ncbi:MAG: VWA-like domain-containing protein, partial [Treponema sp.]|nr:VWA-like domain-containing protein [Treponema sp.]
QQFFTEIERIVKDFSQLIVIQWNTCITNVQKTYKRGDWKSITINGKGGTQVQCVFDWMREQGYTKYPLLIFTDGYFDYDFNVLGIQRIIWVVTATGSPQPIPRGKNIFLH